jgi:hypothetical protein
VAPVSRNRTAQGALSPTALETQRFEPLRLAEFGRSRQPEQAFYFRGSSSAAKSTGTMTTATIVLKTFTDPGTGANTFEATKIAV